MRMRAPLAVLLLLSALPAQGAPPVLYVPPPGAVPQVEPPPQGALSAAPAEPARRRRVRVTVFPFPAPSFAEGAAVIILRDLSEALSRNERLDMRDLDLRLMDFAQEIPVDQVDMARAAYKRGMEALYALELAEAIAQLQESAEQMVGVLPYIKKQELADTMLALAVAHIQKGNRRAGNAALIRLLTWRSDYEADPEQFPPLIQQPLEEARRAVSRLARGDLRVLSEPPGAQVFIDGKYAGVTPLVATGLLTGEHYVTLKKLGYRKGLQLAPVSARAVSEVRARLVESEKFLLVKQAMERVEKELGGARIGPAIETVREALYLDHGVFLRLEPAPEPGTSRLTAYLYDLRTRLLLSRKGVLLSGAADQEQQLGELADALYTGVDLDSAPQPPPEPPPPPRVARQPLYRKWWFLTAAGTITAGVLAIGLGVGLTRPTGCSAGNVCTGSIQY
jgi:hypothetical protein